MCYDNDMSNPTLSPTDQARLAAACQDKAHTYHGGAFGTGGGNTARYMTEILHNRHPFNAYPFATVWSAVEEYLTSHPEVLTYTDADVQQHQQDRAAASEAMAQEAFTKWLAGFAAEALALIDAAEAVDPDHRVEGRYIWDQLRLVIEPPAAATS